MNIKRQLAQLGLKENELSVFLAILDLGNSAIGDIEKTTGLHKQIIYNAATQLQKRDLVTIFEVKGKKQFAIGNLAILEEEAKQQLKSAQELVPILTEKNTQKKIQDKTRIYEGVTSVRQYYVESIRQMPKNSVIHILGANSQRFFKVMDQHSISYRRYEEIRKSRKIKTALLLSGNRKHEMEMNKNRLFLELRLLKSMIQGPMDIMIWNNHVGILFYGTEPYVLDIMGNEIVKGFGEYFNILWKQGRIK
ncbi:MAG TPA: helix-turn-helix domain-containing protein [Candidatus Wunengus sp. YC61]|uniref:helix-turn-helix domain-containing protein n=1 Tax=Candidatus Wunengus sp. YC61 TaxID=3367698 RepID=UPI004027F5D8